MSWPTKKLGELLITNDTGIWGEPIHNNEKGILILRSTNFENDGLLDFSNIAKRKIPKDKIENLQLQDGDILLEKSGGGPEQPVGRVSYFIAPDNQIYTFANFIQRLRSNKDIINSRFLFHYLFYLYKIGTTLRLQSQTTGIRNLNLNLYLKAKIPTPSLHIQHQIVGRLDAIKKAQELNAQQIVLTDELFQSLLHNELHLKGKQWEIVKIGNVCNLMTGGTPRSTVKEYYENGDIKWLVSGDIHQGEIYDCPFRITQKGMENSNAKYLPVNSVLIALNGQGKTRGTVALLRTKATCNQSIVAIDSQNKEQLKSEFLYFGLKDMYNKIRNITGDNQRSGLSMRIIKEIKIFLPPLGIQRQIVEKLQAAQDYKKKLLEQKQKLQELFDSCLDKTMKGELVK